MLSKKEAKDIQSLSQKKYRAELKLFVAEGPKVVSELAANVPGHIRKIYALKNWIDENRELLLHLPFEEISETELTRISQLETPNRVLAVINQFETALPQHKGWTLYLDTIRDPGNMGTILRTADWFGVRDVVCTEGCADIYNPKVVQSTMASIANVRVSYDKDHEWLFRQTGLIYAATLDGMTIPEDAEPGVLVIGNESKGISEEILQLASVRLTIPKKGRAESLNAAVATGILLSKLVR